MSIVVQTLIKDALRISGILASGEALSADQASDHLRTLNRLLDSWNIERLMVYTVNNTAYTLVGGTQSYTLGPGGSLGSTRPMKIEQAFIRVISGSSPYDRPLEIVQDEGWGNISVKAVQSPIPTILYNQNDYPTTTLFLWPTPSVANQLVLYTWNALSQVSDVNASLDFPPGYEEAVLYNFAARLSTEYGFALDPYVITMALNSKALIRSINTTPIYLSADKALLSSRKLGFNYLTGEFGHSSRS